MKFIKFIGYKNGNYVTQCKNKYSLNYNYILNIIWKCSQNRIHLIVCKRRDKITNFSSSLNIHYTSSNAFYNTFKISSNCKLFLQKNKYLFSRKMFDWNLSQLHANTQEMGGGGGEETHIIFPSLLSNVSPKRALIVIAMCIIQKHFLHIYKSSSFGILCKQSTINGLKYILLI